MPVVHEREDGGLYIISMMPSRQHCTWQVSPIGEEVLRSFGLANDKTRVTKHSLFLLKKNKLIYTNNSGFSNSLINERLTEFQKQEMSYRERLFIKEIKRLGDAARGSLPHSPEAKSEKLLAKNPPAKEATNRKPGKPNYRKLDREIYLCLFCQQKHTEKGIIAHLKSTHKSIPVIESEIFKQNEKQSKNHEKNLDKDNFSVEKRKGNYKELEPGLFLCLICQRKYTEKGVVQHLESAHGLWPKKVKDAFETRAENIEKTKSPQKDGYIFCPLCGIPLKHLKKHMKKVHPEKSEAAIRPITGEKPESSEELKRKSAPQISTDPPMDCKPDHFFEMRGIGNFFRVVNSTTGEVVSQHIGDNAKINAQNKLDELHKKFNIG
ncbi:MAG: hypothetical protein PWR01_2528 [Clostridiales bacterium]|nr:hypothetical protein [Clostridiales bacterium]MDN5281455.1 hypothetical protein [Candidatus Ozemobacter sp.]